MRFLCLHGSGTNSQVLETQIAALRYELEHYHVFDFVEGTVPTSIAPEIKAYYPSSSSYFNYFDFDSTSSARTALVNLATFIALEGPYDVVLAFSHGATLAATYLVQQSRINPAAPLPFKCAVFLSGGSPIDPDALAEDKIRLLNGKTDGQLLKLPTANIWGANDELYPGTSEGLSKLCDEKLRAVFVHEEGHDVPSVRAKEAVYGAVNAIRRTIDLANSLQ